MSSRMKGSSPTNSELLTGSNSTPDVDRSYLRLHHKMMQANWNQYIVCMSMRVGMLKQLKLERE